jgi:hypothetical protein
MTVEIIPPDDRRDALRALVDPPTIPKTLYGTVLATGTPTGAR